jgi:ParB-like chromosome segregation protein Spo0J
MANRLNDLGKGKLEAPKLRPEIIIIRPGNNYRDMKSEAVQAHIQWLKQSIREEGVKTPIDVEFIDGKVYLVAGECRLTAAQQLRKEGWDGYIPSLAVRGDEATILARSMIDNGGLTPTVLEFGAAVQRLVNQGWELADAAKYIPSSIANTPAKALKFVRDALELHQAPQEVKKAVREGVEGVQVSPALAVQATRKNRMFAADEIKEAAKKAKAAGQKVAKRPKHAGKATKAKEATLSRTQQLEKIGDGMADNILSGPAVARTYPPTLVGGARAWNQLRGRG